MLSTLRGAIGSRLNYRALQKHRSKLGWRDAPRYTEYLKQAQQTATGLQPGTEVTRNVEEFHAKGVTPLWSPESEAIANSMYQKLKAREAAGEEVWDTTGGGFYAHQGYNGNLWQDFPEFEGLFRGVLGAFYENYFQSHFKIYYSSMFRSQRLTPERSGSQQWHNDSGPGTCIITGFYLHPTDTNSGCLQALPWQESLDIYKGERAADEANLARYCREKGVRPQDVDKMTVRSLRNAWYDKVIQEGYADKVLMPTGKAGLTVPFMNNLLHRGGYPEAGHERYIILTHVYPSDKPTPFDSYRANGVKKKAGYPQDPAF